MKKIVKLLPVAFALLLATQMSFAETVAKATDATSTQQITVPPFIQITHDKAASVEEASAGFNADYSEITLDKAMNTTFKVVTNNPDEVIKLTGTALAGGKQVNAIYGANAKELRLIFTNNGEDTRAAAESAITNIMGTPAKADNANAIAFALTPIITPDSQSAAVAPLATTKEADGVRYKIQNGIYTFTYSLAQTAIADTFSTHDTDGTYKATLTLSQVKP